MNAKVVITGASKGIGRAIALRLAERFELVLHASKEESLDGLWAELPEPARHHRLCADFADPAAVRAFCATLKREHGEALYAVVNNAGIALDKPLLYQPEADIDAMIQVNLKAPVMICKTAMKILHGRRKGVIINISSCVGETGNAFQSVYAATKAGLVAFSKSLAREAGALLPEHDLRILSLSPGFIETSMTDRLPDLHREAYRQQIPARRFGQAADVAALVDFLLTDAAGYINGSEIKINGGLT